MSTLLKKGFRWFFLMNFARLVQSTDPVQPARRQEKGA